MKKIAIAALIAGGVLVMAPPAQAKSSDVSYVQALTMIAFEKLSVSDQMDMCDYWDTIPSQVVISLSKAVKKSNPNISASDIRNGITRGMNAEC